MPKRIIPVLPGYFYHLYNRAVSETDLFREEKNYSFFCSKIRQYLIGTAEIAAYCLMPNHYHILICLKSAELSKAMQRLAMSYTKSFNKIYDRSGHLFQGRFQYKLAQDQRYIDHLSRYIHINPVSSGLVQQPEDWVYSSYREYIGLEPVDFINPNLIFDLWDFPPEMDLAQKQSMYKEYAEEMILIKQMLREF